MHVLVSFLNVHCRTKIAPLHAATVTPRDMKLFKNPCRYLFDQFLSNTAMKRRVLYASPIVSYLHNELEASWWLDDKIVQEWREIDSYDTIEAKDSEVHSYRPVELYIKIFPPWLPRLFAGKDYWLLGQFQVFSRGGSSKGVREGGPHVGGFRRHPLLENLKFQVLRSAISATLRQSQRVLYLSFKNENAILFASKYNKAA